MGRRLARRVQRWAAWALLAGAAVIFVGVVVNLIAVGQAKWATLLVAADLVVGGLAVVLEAED